MNIETLATFLGWCTLINYALLIVATLVYVAFRELMSGIYSKLFGLASEDFAREYLRYLAYYKILVIVFNLVPWIVLRFLL
jgi:hypothetical protein